METPFWVAGAAESVKMSRIGIGASNKSGRRHVGSLAGSSRPLVPFGFAHALLHTQTHTHTHMFWSRCKLHGQRTGGEGTWRVAGAARRIVLNEMRIAYCFHVFNSGGFIHSRVRDPQTGLHCGRRDIPYAQQTVASCDRTWQPRRCRPASPSSSGRRPFRELHVRYNLASRTCRPPKVPARGSFFHAASILYPQLCAQCLSAGS